MANTFDDIVSSIGYELDQIPRWVLVSTGMAAVLIFAFGVTGRKVVGATAKGAGKVAVWGAKTTGELGRQAASTLIERRVGKPPHEMEYGTGKYAQAEHKTPVTPRSPESVDGEYREIPETKVLAVSTRVPEDSTWTGIRATQRATGKPKGPMGFNLHSTKRDPPSGPEGMGKGSFINPRRHYRFIHFI